MGQSGWRLPDDLLKRVRVRCAEVGVRQNVFVERALESALGSESGVPGPAQSSAPSRASSKKVEVALEAREASAKRREGEPVAFQEPRAPKPVPGVRRAREFVPDARQAALNKAKGL